VLVRPAAGARATSPERRMRGRARTADTRGGIRVGTAAAIAAAIFAYPFWRGQRLRPDMRLVSAGVASSSSLGHERRFAFDLELLNSGRGPAENWLVTVASPHRAYGRVEVDHTHAPRPTAAEHLDGSDWSIEWRAADSTDIIPVGHSHRLRVRVGIRSDHEALARCSVVADRMNRRDFFCS
jgi:hypothetical protein